MKRLLLILLLFTLHLSLFTLQAQATNPPAPVPKTGHTTVYLTGDDGTYQDGVAWPSPRFTDNSNGTVTDNLTGLIWLKNANCTETVGEIAKGSGYLTWYNAITWSNGLASGACGLSDGSTAGQWRLPSIRELKSLVDRSRFNPVLPAGHPFSAVQTTVYWSSTSFVNDYLGAAWSVSMYYGEMFYYYKNNSIINGYVWPVRAGQ